MSSSKSPLEERVNQEKNSQQNEIKQSEKLKSRQRPIITTQSKIKKKKHLLSFEDQLEQEAEDVKQQKIKKNPNFKQIKQNIKKTQTLEQQIKAQYIEQTQKLKQQLIQFQFSYWDGGQLVKKLRRKKKEKIKDIIQVCRLELISTHQNLANLSASDFLLVIKDFITPSEMALYQIEALGLKTAKNDLLLNLRNVIIKKDGKDLTLSVNLDGAFKLIQKIKYQKNKSVFPFSNWQFLKFN